MVYYINYSKKLAKLKKIFFKEILISFFILFTTFLYILIFTILLNLRLSNKEFSTIYKILHKK